MEDKKVIWITGASSGIGKALAIKFAENNWIVAASARRENLLDELKLINRHLSPYRLEVLEDNFFKQKIFYLENLLKNLSFKFQNYLKQKKILNQQQVWLLMDIF